MTSSFSIRLVSELCNTTSPYRLHTSSARISRERAWRPLPASSSVSTYRRSQGADVQKKSSVLADSTRHCISGSSRTENGCWHLSSTERGAQGPAECLIRLFDVRPAETC